MLYSSWRSLRLVFHKKKGKKDRSPSYMYTGMWVGVKVIGIFTANITAILLLWYCEDEYISSECAFPCVSTITPSSQQHSHTIDVYFKRIFTSFIFIFIILEEKKKKTISHICSYTILEKEIRKEWVYQECSWTFSLAVFVA